MNKKYKTIIDAGCKIELRNGIDSWGSQSYYRVEAHLINPRNESLFSLPLVMATKKDIDFSAIEENGEGADELLKYFESYVKYSLK